MDRPRRLLGAVLASALLAPAAARADAPPVNGEVVFQRAGNLFATTFQGPAERVITSDGLGNRDPTWSPSSTRIAFSSRRSGTSDIWSVAADGTDPRPLTADPAVDSAPDWSATGVIAFTTRRAGDPDIWAMAFDGTNQRAVVSGPGVQRQPSWSPDGTRLAFSANTLGPYAIWVAGADGANQDLLEQPEAFASDPAWSPDGARIAFAAGPTPTTASIFTINAVGGDVRRVTEAGAGDRYPSWSPDGRQLTFARAGVPQVVELPTGTPVPLLSVAGTKPRWGPVPPPSRPEASETVNTAPTGEVLVTVPSAVAAAPLTRASQVPVGTVVDTTAPGSSVTLTAAAGDGTTTEAETSLGTYTFTQTEPAEAPTNVLEMPRQRGCSSSRAVAAKAIFDRVYVKVKPGRHPPWKVRGPHSINGASATSWVTTVRCNRTITTVRTGVVTVQDRRSGRTIRVPAGRCYVAPSRDPRPRRHCR